MPNAPDPDVDICLLGTPRWRSARHAELPLSRKDAALFALLALGGEQPRDRLAAWLWPDVAQQGANLNLRQRLHKLRRVCGHALVQASATLQLLPGVRIDALHDDDPPGVLLAPFDYGDLEALDHWLADARARQDQRQVDHLAGRAAALEARGELAAAIAACQDILARAPWHEHSWRRLMRLHYLRGDRSSAVATFDRFERTVCAEQGIRPSTETLQLLRTIEHMDTPRAGGTPLPASLVRPPVLVGRHDALQALARAWDDKRAMLVLGEGGIGKSHLLQQFVAGRIGVLAGRARPGDAGSPYGSLSPLLQQLLDRFTPTLDAGTRGELARLLPALGPAPRHDSRQPVLWQAVETTLARAIDQGLTALLIDDLHLADPATLELLRWLLASPALQAMRFAFAARPDEPEPAAPLLRDWIGDSTRMALLRLQGLGLAQVRELVDSLQLSVLREGGHDLADALYRHAGGHPFYTLETIKGLVLAGERPGELPHPASARVMIERRLARLSPAAQDLLRVAALAGADLPPAVAARVMQRPMLDLAGAYAELEAAQVLSGSAFAHDLVHEAASALVPQGLRPALHGELARAMEQLPGTTAARLAHHWGMAGCWADSARCLREAARAARLAGRLAEQQALLERAADACARAGDTAGEIDACCDALGPMMVRLGEQPTLERATALEPRALSDDHRARLAVLRAEALLNLSRFDEALAASAQAMQLAAPGSVAASDATALHGRALALTGRGTEGVDLLQQARVGAAAHGDLPRELVATAALAHALSTCDRRSDAYTVQARAVDLAAELGDRTELAVHTANLATLAFMLGDGALAWRHAGRARQQLLQLGAGGGQLLYNTIIQARSAASLGHLDEALGLLEPLAGPDADVSNPTLHTMGCMALSTLRLWLGRVDDAQRDCPAARDDVHPLAQAGVLLLHVRIAQQTGNDTGPALAALHTLDQTRPQLFDDPVLCLEYARCMPADQALQRLLPVQARARSSGSIAMARSLQLRQVQRGLERDPATAAELAVQLVPEADLGLHPNTYAPEAWWTLASALRERAPHQAESCRLRALHWMAQARLPAGDPQARVRFHQANPLNRAVLASTAITGR